MKKLSVVALLFLPVIILTLISSKTLLSKKNSAPKEKAPKENLTVKEKIYNFINEDISNDYLQNYGKNSQTAQDDLLQVLEVLHSFNSLLKERTLIPTTGNADLVKVLLGHNNDKIQLISQHSPAVNQNNELVDRWMTPLFFHFDSHILPEIRSAGPDKILWNGDDITLSL